MTPDRESPVCMRRKMKFSRPKQIPRHLTKHKTLPKRTRIITKYLPIRGISGPISIGTNNLTTNQTNMRYKSPRPRSAARRRRGRGITSARGRTERSVERGGRTVYSTFGCLYKITKVRDILRKPPKECI